MKNYVSFPFTAQSNKHTAERHGCTGQPSLRYILLIVKALQYCLKTPRKKLLGKNGDHVPMYAVVLYLGFLGVLTK